MKKFFGWRTRRRRSTDRVIAYATVLGDGLRYSGVLQVAGHCRVHGRIMGEGEISGTVELVEGAHWTGSLRADVVRIAGRVDGHIEARSRIELAPGARVTGDLSSPLIVLAEGAVYEGAIQRPEQTRLTRYIERRRPENIARRA